MPFIHDKRAKQKRGRNLDPAGRGRGAGLAGMGYAAAQASLSARSDPRSSTIVEDAVEEQVQGQTTMSLRSSEEINKFVAGLGLNISDQITIKGILDSVPAEAREQVGQVIEGFAAADKGADLLEAVALCGDNLADMIWGHVNPQIEFDTIKRIVQIFPVAARQVEQIVLSASYADYEFLIPLYFDLFPAATHIWAHHDTYGLIKMPQMKVWEREHRNAAV